MPLFTKTSCYYDHDLIVVSQVPAYPVRAENCYLGIYLGHYLHLKGGGRVPDMEVFQPFYRLRCYLNGKQVFTPTWDVHEMMLGLGTQEQAIVEGIVLGILDESNAYEAQHYLRLCAKKLWPYYRSLCLDQALKGVV